MLFTRVGHCLGYFVVGYLCVDVCSGLSSRFVCPYVLGRYMPVDDAVSVSIDYLCFSLGMASVE